MGVSMGDGGSCGPEWTNSRHAIVSNDHALYRTNATLPVWETGMSESDKKTRLRKRQAFKKEVLALEQFIAPSTPVHTDAMSAEDLKNYKYWLAKFKKEDAN